MAIAPKNRLLLYVHEDTWVIRFLGPQREEILRLFGTDVLPTPWRSGLPYADVVSRLSEVPDNRACEFVNISQELTQ